MVATLVHGALGDLADGARSPRRKPVIDHSRGRTRSSVSARRSALRMISSASGPGARRLYPPRTTAVSWSTTSSSPPGARMIERTRRSKSRKTSRTCASYSRGDQVPALGRARRAAEPTRRAPDPVSHARCSLARRRTSGGVRSGSTASGSNPHSRHGLMTLSVSLGRRSLTGLVHPGRPGHGGTRSPEGRRTDDHSGDRIACPAGLASRAPPRRERVRTRPTSVNAGAEIVPSVALVTSRVHARAAARRPPRCRRTGRSPRCATAPTMDRWHRAR